MAVTFVGLSYFTMETSYVGRIYADSLRDNFVGYVPINQPKFDAIKTDFDTEAGRDRPSLAAMLKTEAALVEVMPDDVVLGRFWAIYDRFRRVVPAPSCDRYDAWVPGRGDASWTKPDFVRSQTRTLLDAIHSNYLINIGREQSIKRLKFIIVIAGLVIVSLFGIMSSIAGDGFQNGLLVLAGAGIFGAFLSVLNRLQNAVTADATLQDGIYELTGLRVGWIGIVMSLVMGGGFALVMYGIAMAGVLNLAVPVQTALSPPTQVNAPQPTAASKTIDEKTATTAPGTAASGAANAPPTPSPQSAAASSTAPAPAAPAVAPTPASTTVLTAGPNGRAPLETDVGTPTCERHYSCHEARELGLSGGSEFFKMLLLAFLAGFAERLVPDILNRLSKQDK